MATYIETKDLGLAAFMKLRGLKLVGCENRVFKFEGENGDPNNTKAMLEISYANSCCREHDSNIMYLRQLL